MQVLMGQNVVPESYDLMADALPESDLHQFLADLGALMNAAVAKMPTHADWLVRNCAAPAMAA
jgi:tryptophan halogenase